MGHTFREVTFKELLFSVGERRIKKDKATLDEMSHIKNPLRKLRRFIKYHCGLYSSDRNYLKVFLLLIQTNRRFYELAGYDSFRQYNQFIMDIIKEGQDRGVFSPEINPRIFRNMLLGGINHIFLRWFIVAKVSETDKLAEIEDVTNLLAASVSA